MLSTPPKFLQELIALKIQGWPYRKTERKSILWREKEKKKNPTQMNYGCYKARALL